MASSFSVGPGPSTGGGIPDLNTPEQADAYYGKGNWYRTPAGIVGNTAVTNPTNIAIPGQGGATDTDFRAIRDAQPAPPPDHWSYYGPDPVTAAKNRLAGAAPSATQFTLSVPSPPPATSSTSPGASQFVIGPSAPAPQPAVFGPTSAQQSGLVSNALLQTQYTTPALGQVAQIPGPAPVQFQQQQVDPNQTTQGIVSQLLRNGSPVMERAKALAMEDMAGRGLTSSSIATEAGMRALTDRAIDIAGRDSGIYAEQALQNQRGQYDAATGNANRDLQTQIFNANALNDAQKAQKEFEYRAELTKLSGALDAQSRAALQEAASKLQGNLNGQSMIVTATQRYTTMAQQIRIDPDLATEAKSSAIADLQHDWQAEVSRIAGIYGIALPADYFP